MATRDRAKTILLYADSGDAKTSQAVFLARYIKRKYNKRIRLISGDGGGWAPVEDEGLIRKGSNREGIVDVFNMTNREYYLADWRRLAKGLWPKYKKVGDVIVRRFEETTMEEWGQIGGYFIEGLTSISSGFNSHISKQDNSKDSLTKMMYTAPGFDEDGEHFGATDQGHVGMIQNELYNICQQFGTLPVEFIVWTALVGQATEKSLRKLGLEISEVNPTFGPKLAGSAKTAEAPSWFSDCLHMQGQNDMETRDIVGGGQTRVETKRVFAFFQKHIDPTTGNLYLAKSSVGMSVMKVIRERFPGGCVEFTLDQGLDGYLEMVDNVKEQELSKRQ